MMKYIFILVAALLISPNAFAQDSKEDRMAAAVAYEKIMPVEGLMGEMLAEFKKSPQLKLSHEDIQAIAKTYDIDELRQKMLESMVNNFTTNEINALTVFYSSPEGKAIMKKMPKYMSELMPYIQQRMVAGLTEYMQTKAAQPPQ
ncbi:MAG: DUF2059 domain-containing protein [Pseudomonadota bacterium]